MPNFSSEKSPTHTRHDLPMVEDAHAERLALSVHPQVCLEPEGVDGRDERLRRRKKHYISDLFNPIIS